jgi:hypothetical protein
MLKYRILLAISLIFVLPTPVLTAQNFQHKEKDVTIEKEESVVIESPLKTLPEYEKLSYTVRWLGVPVGEITASINGIKDINGRPAYELKVTAKTNDFCSAIYKIDDKFISYMDTENHCTLRHEVYRREGRYKKDAITDFDQINHRAHFRNMLDKSEKDFEIPPKVQDTLSACYYFRLLPINIGERIEYAVCNNEANYLLYGVAESKGFIRMPKFGKVGSFYIQPYAKLKGEEVKKGRVSGYFSCDPKRIPLMAVVKAPMFTEVTATLYKVQER